MIIVISLMVCGIILGYAFKERNLKFVQKLINYAIFLLLFLLSILSSTKEKAPDSGLADRAEAFVLYSDFTRINQSGFRAIV